MGIFSRLDGLEFDNKIIKQDIHYYENVTKKEYGDKLDKLTTETKKLRDEILMLKNYIKATSNDDYFVEYCLDVLNWKSKEISPPTALKIYHKGSIYKIPTIYEIPEPYVSTDEENKIAGIITIKSKVSDVVAIVDLRHKEVLEIRNVENSNERGENNG